MIRWSSPPQSVPVEERVKNVLAAPLWLVEMSGWSQTQRDYQQYGIWLYKCVSLLLWQQRGEAAVWPLETKKINRKDLIRGCCGGGGGGILETRRVWECCPLICTLVSRHTHSNTHSPKPSSTHWGLVYKDSEEDRRKRAARGASQYQSRLALLRVQRQQRLLSTSPRRLTGGGAAKEGEAQRDIIDVFSFVTSDNSMNTQKSTCFLSPSQGRVNGRWGSSTMQTLPPCWIREDESCGVHNRASWITLTSGPFDGEKLYAAANASAGG